jgi:peptide chain release factor 1
MNKISKWWDKVVNDYIDLNDKLNNCYDDLKEMVRIQKRIAELEDAYKLAQEAQNIADNISFLFTMKEDSSDKELEEEIKKSQYDLSNVEIKYTELIKSQKPKQNKLIMEVRPGTGGQEAGLFAALLVEMYKAYSDQNGWDWEILSYEDNSIGGISQVTASIEGNDAYGIMQYESGVHRVQRIPKTEANGRIHTSTATVAILSEPEEANVEIDENYIRIDVFRASGAGGQHVNKTESAIRLTYEHPDLNKIVISIQDEKSQHKNKSKAMKILRAKVQEQLEAKVNAERSNQRKNQVGTGERSEKIRTYNFQQNRVTDHRSGLSVHNLQYDTLLLPKDLDLIFQSLRIAELDEIK